MSKLDKVFGGWEKKYNTKVIPARELCAVKRLQLDSPSLNFIFGGGFPLGRICMLHGPESGGKSTLATYIAAQIQQKYEGHNTVLFVDFEYAFDCDHAATLGLDVDNNFVLLQPDNGEDAFMMIKEAVDTGEVGLVILDSTTAIASKSQVDDPNKATFGAGGKIMSNGLKYVNPALTRNKCSMIMIAQERQNVGVMYGPDFKVAAGGWAPKYYSSWTARLTRSGDIANKDKSLAGITIKVKNSKNKVGIPKREAEINLNFETGINSDDEYMDYLVRFGIVQKAGAMYSNPDWGLRVRGIDAVAEFLHLNPEIYEEVKAKVNQMILGHTCLDNEADVTDVDEDDNLTEDEAWKKYEDEEIPYDGLDITDEK